MRFGVNRDRFAMRPSDDFFRGNGDAAQGGEVGPGPSLIRDREPPAGSLAERISAGPVDFAGAPLVSLDPQLR